MADYKDVMLDLETMGSNPESAIVSIGAVKFDLNENDTVELILNNNERTFYTVVDLTSSVMDGGRCDPETIIWWLGQSGEARKIFSTFEKSYLLHALHLLNEFLIPRFGRYQVWGNGCSFDCVILREAYKKAKLPMPWDFRGDRDLRTLRELALRKESSVITSFSSERLVAHNALDDAVQQVLLAQRYRRVIYGQHSHSDVGNISPNNS